MVEAMASGRGDTSGKPGPARQGRPMSSTASVVYTFRDGDVPSPGSAWSIGFGAGGPVYEGTPGSVRALHLVVADIEKAREELLARGVDVGEVTDVGGGVKYAGFSDPDGNGLTLQEMPWRTG